MSEANYRRITTCLGLTIGDIVRYSGKHYKVKEVGINNAVITTGFGNVLTVPIIELEVKEEPKEQPKMKAYIKDKLMKHEPIEIDLDKQDIYIEGLDKNKILISKDKSEDYISIHADGCLEIRPMVTNVIKIRSVRDFI